MGKFVLSIIVFALWVTFTFPSLNGLAEHTEVEEKQLQCFLSELHELQSQYNILKRWNTEDIRQVEALAEKHNLLPEMKELKTVEQYDESSAMLLLIFREAYGHKYTWTPEERVNYQTEMNALGYNVGNQFILPNENDLSLEEAILLAKKKIFEQENQPQYGGYSTDGIDEYRVYGEFKRADDGTHNWHLEFFIPDDRVWFSEFEVMVAPQGTAVSVTWNDPQMYINIGRIWRQRIGTSFAFFSLEEKYAFYNELLKYKDYQEKKYGTLFGYENTVLNHVHSLPHDNELSLETACYIADEYVDQHGGPEDKTVLKRSVSFYRDDPEEPVYEVCYYIDNKVWRTVRVRAVDGVIQ